MLQRSVALSLVLALTITGGIVMLTETFTATSIVATSSVTTPAYVVSGGTNPTIKPCTTSPPTATEPKGSLCLDTAPTFPNLYESDGGGTWDIITAGAAGPNGIELSTLCAPPTVSGTLGDYNPTCATGTFGPSTNVLDLDLTGGDLTLNCLKPGTPGQLLTLINEGGANLFIVASTHAVGCVTSAPFQIENFHTSYLTVTESSSLLLRYGPDRYGTAAWQVISKADNVPPNIRDVALPATDLPTLTSCGTSPVVIKGGLWSGLIQVGTGATGCTITLHGGLSSGQLNCVVSPETFPTTFTYTSEAVANTITLTGAGVAGIKFHFLCNWIGE